MASMSFFDEVVKGVGGFFEHISPIEIFNKNQEQKLAASFGNLVKSPSGHSANAYRRQLSEEVGASAARYKIEGRPMNLGEYFSGQNFDGPGVVSTPAQTAMRRNVRIGAAATMGIYGASSMVLGDDSPVAKASGGALNFAMHAGVTKALHKYTNPTTAAIYGGLGVVNMLRSGDNLGPF